MENVVCIIDPWVVEEPNYIIISSTQSAFCVYMRVNECGYVCVCMCAYVCVWSRRGEGVYMKAPLYVYVCVCVCACIVGTWLTLYPRVGVRKAELLSRISTPHLSYRPLSQFTLQFLYIRI